MNWKKWLPWTLVAVASPFALLLIAQWTSPWWLDQGAVKGQFTRIIASATGGSGQYERIDLRIFPRPRAIVTGGRFSLAGTLDVEARSVTAAIRLFPLLRGKVEPYEVRLIAPQLRLRLADTAATTTKERPPFTLPAADSAVRSAVQRIAAAMPGLTLLVQDGRLELILAGRAPRIMEHVDVEADVTSSAINAAVSFTSATLERFAAKFSISPADLRGDVDIKLTGLHLPRLGALFGVADGWPVDSAVVDAEIALRLRGLTDAQATVRVSAPRMALHFGKGRIAAGGISLEATAITFGDSIEVALQRFSLAAPRVTASGTLTRNGSGAVTIAATLGDLDLAAMQQVANALAPGVSSLQGLPVRVTAGTASALTLQARAANIGDLFALPAMDIRGTVTGAAVTVTAFHDLPVRDARLSAALTGGVLTVRQISAEVEEMRAHDGSFRIDLNPAVSPLQGAIAVDVDLERALALAPRFLDSATNGQLAHVTQLRGSTTVQLALEGNTNTVVPRISIASLELFARYAAVPFPIRIARGMVTVTPKALTVRGLAGLIGQSAFDGVAARLSLTEPSVLTATQGSLQLALPELVSWARTQPDLKQPLDSITSVTGGLSVNIEQLALPLDSVKRLTFRVRATPRALQVDAPSYGPRIRIEGGVVRVTEGSIAAQDVAVSALDADVVAGGSTGDYRTRIDAAQVSVSGTIGLEAQRWVQERAKLPASLRLRGALTLTGVMANWQRDGPARTSGSLRVRGGPAMEFALRQERDLLDVERLTLRDSVTDATISGGVDGAHFHAACDGHVSGSSIDHIFVEPPVRLERFQCEFRTDGDFNKPRETVATGTVSGSRIVLPPGLLFPVTIDGLDIEAKGSSVMVKTLRVVSGASRVDVTGSVAIAEDRFLIDADVRGDTVIVPMAPPAVDSGAAKAASDAPHSRESVKEQQSKFYHSLRAIPATGVVRVDVGFVKILNLEIAPLVANATIEGTQAKLEVTRGALCGIALTGGITLRPDSIDLIASIQARDLAIERSVTCLTNQRIDITGSANVDAHVEASGAMGTIRDRVHGTFTLTATKGRINRFDALAEVLRVINATQALVGQGAELGGKGIAYNSAVVKLDFAAPRVIVKEATLDASGFEAVAKGNVDFATRKLDVDVLVAPIKTLNWIVSHIPIVRSIFGGTVLAIPVHVGGTVEKPAVVPLGVEAVGSRLVDLLGNTLKLPATLVKAPAKDSAVAAPTAPTVPPPKRR